MRPYQRLPALPSLLHHATPGRGNDVTGNGFAFREHQLLRLRHGPRRIVSYPFRFVPEAGGLISLSAAFTARCHCSRGRFYLLALPLLTADAREGATARARRTVKGVLRVRRACEKQCAWEALPTTQCTQRARQTKRSSRPFTGASLLLLSPLVRPYYTDKEGSQETKPAQLGDYLLHTRSRAYNPTCCIHKNRNRRQTLPRMMTR